MPQKTQEKTSIAKRNNSPLPGTDRPLLNKAARAFALTAAAAGAAEITLDGGSAEAAVVMGSFAGLSGSSFGISLTSIPGGGTAAANWYGASYGWSFSSQQLVAAQTAPGSSYNMVDVAGGSVGTGNNFGDYGQLTANFDGYIGFRFDNGADNGDFHYGWVRATGDASGTVLTLNEWAYEDQANTPITAPAVPEPGSLALLAMGAGALATYRRRKN